jgi:2-oxoglutarate ferredoxin oxidoreductase subunit beta
MTAKKGIFHSDYENQWCPGCGNFGILTAMQDAFETLDLTPRLILIVSGIGQAAKTPHFLQCNTFHGLHGRALPLATGAKIANHDLNIVVNSGDGDCYGEGGNHFLHAVRKNSDITLLVHNNKVYGLTKGQASPTSDMDMVTKIQKQGVISEPINPLAVAIVLGAGFVARGFSGDKDHLSELIQLGIKHKGFSLIDILQPCVSFNTINTHDWYKKRVYALKESDHSFEDPLRAIELSFEWGDKIPVGVFYKKEKPTLTDQMSTLQKKPLTSGKYDREKLKKLLSEL